LLLARACEIIAKGIAPPNQEAVANNLDKSLGDPRANALIGFLDSEPLANLPHDYDLIAPEELSSIYEMGFSQATIQSLNLQRRMDDIRAGSTGAIRSACHLCADRLALRSAKRQAGSETQRITNPIRHRVCFCTGGPRERIFFAKQNRGLGVEFFGSNCEHSRCGEAVIGGRADS
jgi:hypothetical protein